MITFKGKDYFSSGPTAIQPGQAESRDLITQSPGSAGAFVLTQGTVARELTQRGTLLADDAKSLQALIDAIEAEVGSPAGALIDEYDRTWSDCLMRRVQLASIHRLGPRFAIDYTIQYLQLYP